MIDEETKEKLIKELEKFGIASAACVKIGIDKATYYRWRKSDPGFRKKADAAVRVGHASVNELAEYSLVGNLKKGDQRAIEYQLSHCSKRYRAKPATTAIIIHKTEPKGFNPQERTAEDDFDDLFKNNQSTQPQVTHSKIVMGMGYCLALPDGTIA
jgi:hypothetical protein